MLFDVVIVLKFQIINHMNSSHTLHMWLPQKADSRNTLLEESWNKTITLKQGQSKYKCRSLLLAMHLSWWTGSCSLKRPPSVHCEPRHTVRHTNRQWRGQLPLLTGSLRFHALLLTLLSSMMFHYGPSAPSALRLRWSQCDQGYLSNGHEAASNLINSLTPHLKLTKAELGCHHMIALQQTKWQ